jgi:hypothetical protein
MRLPLREDEPAWRSFVADLLLCGCFEAWLE